MPRPTRYCSASVPGSGCTSDQMRSARLIRAASSSSGSAACDVLGAVLLDHDADGPKYVSASSMASPIEKPRCRLIKSTMSPPILAAWSYQRPALSPATFSTNDPLGCQRNWRLVDSLRLGSPRYDRTISSALARSSSRAWLSRRRPDDE